MSATEASNPNALLKSCHNAENESDSIAATADSPA